MKGGQTSITSILISCLIVMSAANSYYKSSDDTNSRSSFFLPYLPQGSIISAVIDVQGASVQYNVQLWRPLYYPPSSPEDFVVFSGAGQYKSNPLSLAGSWRLVVSPLYSTSAQFQFTITISANNLTVGKYVDVARSSRIFIIYHNSQGNKQISLSVPTGFAGQATPYLYGPFQSLAVSGGLPITTTNVGAKTIINYTTKGKQFFYLSIVQTSQMIQSAAFITVNYDTDKFQCPFTNDFSDYNSIFAGCSNVLPTRSFPCLAFNDMLQKCQQCQSPWVVDSVGVCNIDISCPQGQYFNLGGCYNALPNCNDFDLTGGLCHQCQSGYTLQNYNNGSQACTPNAVTCQSNQYLVGNTCFNYVDNCANFQSSTGTCLDCRYGYGLNQNKCTQIVVQSVNCQLGFNSVNGFCQPIDANCIFYYNNNTCMVCAPGYLLKATCEKLICGARQYSWTGQCLDASQLCATFDPLYGKCLTCISLYFLQTDGTCLQSIPSQNYASSPQNCPDNYYNRQGTCVQINPLCGTFDSSTGACTTCVDNNYYLNPSGGCILISSYCTTYRTYFSNGNCFNVANQCDAYDPSNGYCLSCRDMTKLTSDGRCLYSSLCVGRQYSLPNGQCADVSNNCGDFDRNNGSCLTCVAGYQLNAGGICCYALNYLLDTNCFQFFKTNCITNFRNPLFPYCTKCATGYNSTNGVYGRCNPII